MWKNIFQEIISSLNDLRSQRFFSLLAWGDYGAYSLYWKKSFQNLGVLHLLVLSGTQMNCFVKSQFHTFLFLSHNTYFIKLRLLIIPFLAITSFYYLKITQFSPPLVRAFLSIWVALILTKLGFRKGILTWVMMIHVILFPHHLKELSFYLSWICFLLLKFVEDFSLSAVIKILILTMLSQIVVLILGLDGPESFNEWVRVLAANILFIFIFDKFLAFPIGFLLSTSFFISLFPNFLSIFPIEILKNLFSPLGKGILVLIHLARRLLLYI